MNKLMLYMEDASGNRQQITHEPMLPDAAPDMHALCARLNHAISSAYGRRLCSPDLMFVVRDWPFGVEVEP